MNAKKLLFALLFLAFALRVWGLGHGLPFEYAHDEEYFMDPLFRSFSRLDFDPHWFGAPGSFMMYTVFPFTALVFAFTFVSALASGKISGFAEFSHLHRGGPLWDLVFGPSVLAGRLVMVAYAVLTVWAAYRIAEKLYGGRTAAFAAFLLAVAPLHVEHSRLVRPDVPSAMLIAFSTLFLVRFLEDPRDRKALCLSAFFSGVSMAAKWTSGLSLLPVLWVALSEDGRHAPKDLKALADAALVRTGAFFFLGFFVFAPFAVIHFPDAYAGLVFETISLHAGSESGPVGENLLWYVRHGFVEGFGHALVAALALAGLVRTLFDRSRSKRALALFPLIYFSVIVAAKFRWARWTIPLLPFEAIFAAVCVREIFLRLKGRRAAVVLASILLAGAQWSALAADFQGALRQARPSQTVVAKHWIEENLPPGSSVVYEIYGPPLAVHPRPDLKLVDRQWKLVISKPLDAYRREGVEYLALTGVLREDYFRDAARYPREIARYREIAQKTELVRSFRDPDDSQPAVDLYRIRA